MVMPLSNPMPKTALLDAVLPNAHSEIWKHFSFAPFRNKSFVSVSPEYSTHLHSSSSQAMQEEFVLTASMDKKDWLSRWSKTNLSDLFFEKWNFEELPQLFRLRFAEGSSAELDVNIQPAAFVVSEQENFVCHSHIDIRVLRGANIKLHMNILSQNSAFMNTVITAHVDEGASLQLLYFSPALPLDKQFVFHRINVQREASFKCYASDHNSLMKRYEWLVRLQGERANASIKGLGLLADQEKLHHVARVIHEARLTTSEQVCKSIASHQSEYEFNSLVHVEQKGAHSQSSQLNRNLILNDAVRIYSRPQLMIDIDDVQCHHGVATGQPDENELYYLRSRGIDSKGAKELLCYGFARDVASDLHSYAFDGACYQNLLQQKIKHILND